MKEQPSNPCEKVSFILTYDQLEAAYNIYREQFISCDFPPLHGTSGGKNRTLQPSI